MADHSNNHRRHDRLTKQIAQIVVESVSLGKGTGGFAIYPRFTHNQSSWGPTPLVALPRPIVSRNLAVAALRKALKVSVQPKFAIIHGFLRAYIWPDILRLGGLKLIVIEDQILERDHAGRLNAHEQILGPNHLRTEVNILLLNPRSKDGAVLDEMDCFDNWSGTDRRLHWAWGDSLAERLEAIKKVWRSHCATNRRLLPKTVLGADWLGVKEAACLHDVVRKKTLFRHYGIDHPRVSENLENLIRRKTASPYALVVSSGSAALNCAFAALDLKSGDEVILPAFSWFSCYNAILNFGLSPVFAEIDASLNLDPVDFERCITPQTKAVILVHYQGGPANVGKILATAKSQGIRVIEDCAQALGSRYQDKALGTLGDIGIYSFQANKIISCGEGGALVCHEQRHFERAVRYHDLGILRPVFLKQTGKPPVTDPLPGNQYRMSEIAAAVAMVQLNRLPWIIRRCRRHSHRLRTLLTKSCPRLTFRPTGDAKGDSQITLFIDWQDATRTKAATRMLEADGITVGPSSGMTNLLNAEYVRTRSCVHGRQGPTWPPTPPESASFPQTELWLQRYTPLAMGPRYLDADIDRIAQSVIAAYNKLFQ